LPYNAFIKNGSQMKNHVLWEKVCSYQNLRLAWNKVKKNGGSPGVDHVTLEEFEQNLEENLNILQKQLENENYISLPVLRIYIDGRWYPAFHWNFCSQRPGSAAGYAFSLIPNF